MRNQQLRRLLTLVDYCKFVIKRLQTFANNANTNAFINVFIFYRNVYNIDDFGCTICHLEATTITRLVAFVYLSETFKNTPYCNIKPEADQWGRGGNRGNRPPRAQQSLMPIV